MTTVSTAQVMAAPRPAGPPLQVANVDAVEHELQLVDPKVIRTENIDPALAAKADEWAAKLLDVSLADHKARQDHTNAVEMLGTNEQQQASKAHALLQTPLKRLNELGAEGGKMASDLVELKVQFDAADPSRFNFEPGWMGRWLGWMPWVGKPINRFFTKFEAAGNVIDALFDSLEQSKMTIMRDIQILTDEGVRMRQVTSNLERVILVAKLVDKRLEERIAGMQEGEQKIFVQEELIYPLRQRISDLEQQMVVNQQGILMYEVLVRNNKELIRGVDRCFNVTRPALQIGVTAAIALANQKITIKKIQALDAAGNKLIDFNAKLLRGQGTEIHKMAASASLSDTVLAEAMRNSIAALDDIRSFRLKAIQSLGAAIEARQPTIEYAKKAIERMDQGTQVRSQFQLTLAGPQTDSGEVKFSS